MEVQTIFKKETFHKNKIERKPKKSRADVLLVYPIWVEKRGRGKLQRMLPPLGILSIASFLEKFGYEVHIVDLHAEEICPEEFRAIVRSLNPRFIGITVLSAHVTPAHHIAKICKEEVPEGKVFVGGVHAEAAPEEMLQNPFIDAVCRGDGEEVMLELVRGDSYGSIAGLSYRRNNEVVHNLVRELNTNLDSYPFPGQDTDDQRLSRQLYLL